MAIFDDKNGLAVLTRVSAGPMGITKADVQKAIMKLDSLIAQQTTMNAYKRVADPGLMSGINVLTQCKQQIHHIVLPHAAQAEQVATESNSFNKIFP